MLQDAFVDKNGLPMASGTITCFQDSNRTILKNWYYQTGFPGNYNYIALPNPLTLSAAGTIADVNGVDTIPFFYPHSELDQSEIQPYFITIVSLDKKTQLTRQNFPFNINNGNSNVEELDVENYIINNGFWRNIGTINLTNTLNATLAPSQHNGFNMPDMTFIKNNIGGQDIVTFTKFPLTEEPILTGDITPEFYVNHTCSNSNTGETQKVYQWPISLHVNTLASQPFTFTIQGQNVGGVSPGQNVISIYILQFTGTGTVSPAPILIGEITLNTEFQKYEITTVFPPTEGLTLGNGADDALYLQVQMPLNMQCSINFTKPSIYLSTLSPINNFQTYDQVDAFINSPRTGDIRTSLNSFYYFGWVPMNDGTIGNSSSNSTCRANVDTWPLFNLLWNIAKPFDSGSNFNPICQMLTSTGSLTNFSSSAILDFNSNNALSLTKSFGRVLSGTVPIATLLSKYVQSITASNSTGSLLITVGANSNLYNGQPINFTTTGTLPGGLVANAIYYIANYTPNIGGDTFNVATTYANAIAGTPVVSWSTAGSNSSVYINQLGTSNGEYAHTQLLSEIASHTHNAPPPSGNFWCEVQIPTGSQSLPGGNSTSAFPTTGDVTRTNSNAMPLNIVQPETFINVFIKL